VFFGPHAPPAEIFETWNAKLVPAKKKLWGDHVDDEEDSFPSPLAKSAPPRIFHAPVSPAVAESLIVFSAATKMKAATAAELVTLGKLFRQKV
jgi:hypothetical protein